jgi:hypothetical protein
MKLQVQLQVRPAGNDVRLQIRPAGYDVTLQVRPAGYDVRPIAQIAFFAME